MNAAGDKVGLWLHGSSGRMGLAIQEALGRHEFRNSFRLVGGSARRFEGELFHQGKEVTPKLLAETLQRDHVDLVVDFSTPEANRVLLEAIEQGQLAGKAVLLGTTGFDDLRIQAWKSAAKDHNVAVLFAPNTSLGVITAMRTAMAAAGVLAKQGFDIEIVETHHRMKRDAPSGTALFLGKAVKEACPNLVLNPNRQGAREDDEIGLHAVRGGGVFGEHEIRFISDDEEFCISHRALTRNLFARGALVLGEWLVKQKAGIYRLADVDLS